MIGDEDKIDEITKELSASHNCDGKVFNPELIKLVGSQGFPLVLASCFLVAFPEIVV